MHVYILFSFACSNDPLFLKKAGRLGRRLSYLLQEIFSVFCCLPAGAAIFRLVCGAAALLYYDNILSRRRCQTEITTATPLAGKSVSGRRKCPPFRLSCCLNGAPAENIEGRVSPKAKSAGRFYPAAGIFCKVILQNSYIKL
jgi:hypothetical protein